MKLSAGLLKSRRHTQELSLFYRQLAIMLRAGVQLGKALDSLYRGYEAAFATVVLNLQHHVITGFPLSNAMAAQGLPFSAVDIGMIAAAEQSGGLVQTLEKLAALTERRLMLRKKVIAALTYPAVQFLCICSVLLFFVLAIAPGDEAVFSGLGGELPWPTRVLMSLSGWLRSPGLILVVLTGAVVGVLLVLRRLHDSPEFRLQFDHMCLQIPILGQLWRKAAAVRVAETLEGMLSVGVPLVTALTLTEAVVANTRIKRSLSLVRRDIRDGEGVGKSLAQQAIFGRMVAAMVECGEESGKLDDMLRLVATRLQEDVETALDAMVKVIEPILLCVAGLGAAFVAIAGLMPFMQLISNI